MVVTADDVTECRETLFDTLYLDGIGDGISDVLEFLIGGGGGEKEASAVTMIHSAMSIIWSLHNTGKDRTQLSNVLQSSFRRCLCGI
jgi:hypothetical protein